MIVVVWTVIALGLYRCSAQLSDTDEGITGETKEKDEKIQMTPEETDGKITIKENVPEIPFDENVRILLMNQGYRGIYHTELQIVCREGLTDTHNGEITESAPESE